MTARSIDLRLVLPAAVAWLAALVATNQPQWRTPLVGAGWATSAVALCWVLLAARLAARAPVPPSARGTRARRDDRLPARLPARRVRVHRDARRPGQLTAALLMIAVCAAAVGLMAGAVTLHDYGRRPPAIDEVARGGKAIELTAVVTQAVEAGTGEARAFGSHGSSHYAATLVRAGAVVASVPVLVFDAEPAERMGIGATLAFSGVLVETDAGDDVSYLAFGRTSARVVAPPPWYLAWADSLRSTFSTAAARLPGDGALLEPGLAIGDTSLVSDELDESMKAASLSHLTAVSGANCAIIVALVMLAGAALGLRRGWRIALSLAGLFAFVVLVTPGASVVRAAVMATLVLVALAAGRPLRGLPVLALAVLVLLVGDPWLCSNYGFALSVLATGGLLLLASPIARLLARWMPVWLAATLAVPIAAQLACQPVLVLLNPTVSVLGVVANTLAAPAAPIATVVGLAACILLPVVPVLGGALLWVAWLPAAWVAAIARFFSGASWAALPWPGDLTGALLLATVTTLALVALLAPVRRRVRAALALAAVACVVSVAAAAGGAAIAASVARPSNWQVAACDIGQGDAMVVRSGDRIALIDTGPDDKLLAACLAELAIDKIDLLVLSHYDLDHVGGVSAVIGRVSTALVGPTDGSADDAIVAALRDSGASIHQARRGDAGLMGQLAWRVLWPPSDATDAARSPEPGNDASITIEFRPVPGCHSGCVSSLFVGDLGEDSQDDMLALNPALAPVQVLEVAHHGSSDQSENLYRVAGAAVGLIGVGVDNGYGHPTRRLLDILKDNGTAAARTDTDGLVLVAQEANAALRPGASTLIIWRTHSDVGGHG